MTDKFPLLPILEASAFFDAAWYLAQYRDVALTGLSAAEHYVRVGALIGRNPGPEFDGAAYLARYLDVAARRDNPVVHYELYGRGEGRVVNPARPQPVEASGVPRVDVVIPVYNALEDVKACLQALREMPNGYPLRALVINDGSDAETTQWLRGACAGLDSDGVQFLLIEQPENLGYTQAVNRGLKASDAPYVVTLNSDTIVTPYWLDGLIRCMTSDPAIGVCGPLSNAASWQNVPELYAPDGSFAINALPLGMTALEMAEVVRDASRKAYPRSSFVNGFCFMIRRAVLEAVGYMDETSFPLGYGEENDFCLRAQDAGFELAYADDTYVFHAKSKSFGSARRLALSQQGSDAIRAKHTAEKFNLRLEQVKDTGAMDSVRALVRRGLQDRIKKAQIAAPALVMRQKILFLLPVRGGGGGAHSVVQEAAAMRAMGVQAQIAMHDADYHNFIDLYGDIPEAREMFFGFRRETIVAAAQAFDVVVATIFTSVALLKRIVSACPWILPVYYAQDYEPWFFEEGTVDWHVAHDSYTAIPGAVIMAKTDWICRQIEKIHEIRVNKIWPSIDHETYHPCGDLATNHGCLTISAMIRPTTPRRGAARSMELLGRLKDFYQDRVEIRIFGCSEAAAGYSELRRDFAFENHGVLKRRQVADVLRASDIFIDLSDYQAFGRTGLEAMACNTVVMVPREGGADDYARDGYNALVVDTLDVEGCFERLKSLIAAPEKIAKMRLAALETANAYSPRRAAMSELVLFARQLAERRSLHPEPLRKRVALLPALTSSQLVTITGSGYVRLLSPYRQDALAETWETRVFLGASLPRPGEADIAVVQRDLPESLWEEITPWTREWRAAGGRLIYEIDDDLTDVAALEARDYVGGADALAKRVRAYLEAADVVTVSTPHLAALFQQYAAKIMVVPNRIDAELWKKPLREGRADPDRIRIGYVGTPTHTEDLRSIQEVMSQLDQRADVSVEVIGAFQKIDPLFGTRIGLPHNSVYPVFTEWLQQAAEWDIAIIPLVDDAFNRSKSYLKFVECAALGAAIVCTDNAEYRQVAVDGENCLLVPNTQSAWREALTRLIDDPLLRQKLAARAHADAYQNWTVQRHVDLYHSVLNRALYARSETQ
jgi:GT2 family glycosyltransferase/glycosyltransferase involved in cell wall biosynthesis